MRKKAAQQRLTRWTAVVVVVLAAIGGLRTVIDTTGAIVRAVGGGDDQAAVETSNLNSFFAAADCAQDFVKAFLTTPKGREIEVLRFYTGDMALPESPIEASDPRITGVKEQPGPAAGTQQWAFVVSMAQRNPGSLDTIRVRYLTTVFVDTRGNTRATKKPTPLGPQDWGVDVPLDYPTPVDSKDPTVIAISGFLRALLSGGPDMTRYAAKGNKALPTNPPLYGSITVTSVRSQPPTMTDDGHQKVRMLATIKADSFASYEFDFPLELTATDGGWMVSAIEWFPALGSSASAPPTTTTAPTTTSKAPTPSTPGNAAGFGKP